MNWTSDRICLRPDKLDVSAIAQDIYQRTCRTSFDAPGFCVIDAGTSISSVVFRQLMADLKREMAAIHESQTQKTLIYLSAARFDQQQSTRPHLDGGPEECFLMLGYEPSDVLSEIEISDYTKCAADHQMTPQEFLASHNPMFQSGYDLLRPYTTRLACFTNHSFQIVCINNSSAACTAEGNSWLGTLHTATILKPDESKRRVINSTMIAPASIGASDHISSSALHEFIHTSHVKRRGHDKPELADDR